MGIEKKTETMKEFTEEDRMYMDIQADVIEYDRKIKEKEHKLLDKDKVLVLLRRMNYQLYLQSQDEESYFFLENMINDL